MVTSSLKLIPYTRRYRRELFALIQEQYRLHIHLDWQTVEDWIDALDTPLYLAWSDRTLVGAMAASVPLHGASWLRLVAIDDDVDAQMILNDLWSALCDQLIDLNATEVGVLLMRPWLAQYLPQMGFSYRENIITLRRHGSDFPAPLRNDIAIRSFEWNEIPAIAAVDHAAFGPMWQLSTESLREAAHMSASFTVAEINHQLVGYQLSTQHHDGAHLARLAVRPELQGFGIGGALVGKMISSFAARRILGITVNTQQTNVQSQRLYQRYGFVPNGLDMPYWSQKLIG